MTRMDDFSKRARAREIEVQNSSIFDHGSSGTSAGDMSRLTDRPFR